MSQKFDIPELTDFVLTDEEEAQLDLFLGFESEGDEDNPFPFPERLDAALRAALPPDTENAVHLVEIIRDGISYLYIPSE